MSLVYYVVSVFCRRLVMPLIDHVISEECSEMKRVIELGSIPLFVYFVLCMDLNFSSKTLGDR